MATRYRFGNKEHAHFVTFAVVNWIPALSRPLYKDIVVDSLKYCVSEKGLLLHGWVIMNDHVHLIVSSDKDELQDIMRDLKKYTAMRLLAEIEGNMQEGRRSWMMWLFKSAGKVNPNNKNYQFWQQDNHPIALSGTDMMLQKLNYIHDNPVRAGIVHEPEHYIYSSAGSILLGNKGLLPVVSLI